METAAPITAGDEVARSVSTRLISLVPLEIALAAIFLGFTLLIGFTLGLPFSLPDGNRAAFVGVHYLYPLAGIAIWAAIMVFQRSKQVTSTFFVALPAYALVLLCHFNLKLWIPHLNPRLWDQAYWISDQAIRPLIDGAMAFRMMLDPVIPLASNFYMLGFIALFYLAFGYACLKRPETFRELVLAAIIMQIMGSFAYLVAPALGPFLFEAGVEPPATLAQQSMLASWHANTAGGAEWIVAEGGRQITVGLAAMPSLHAGGAFLFLLYALRYTVALRLPFTLLFAFIAIDAVANRWHYAVDLPAGMALAAIATWIAAGLVKQSSPIGHIGKSQE